MAHSLVGERPRLVAAIANPFRALARWINDLRAARAQRAALSNLLELDASRLYDLGIDRSDVIDALRDPYRRHAGAGLAARRARSARDWHSHP